MSHYWWSYDDANYYGWGLMDTLNLNILLWFCTCFFLFFLFISITCCSSCHAAKFRIIGHEYLIWQSLTSWLWLVIQWPSLLSPATNALEREGERERAFRTLNEESIDILYKDHSWLWFHFLWRCMFLVKLDALYQDF